MPTRLVIEATEDDAVLAEEAIARALCAAEDRPGPLVSPVDH
jgi:hypothetical protein